MTFDNIFVLANKYCTLW